MKFVDNILYIEFQEAVDAGVSIGTIKSAQFRANASWNFIDDPVDNRKILIQYDTLKPKYQALIVEKFGNPYVYAGQKTVKSALEADHEALKTLLTYRFENGKALKDAEITALSKACDVLKHLVSIEKRPIKQLGYDSKASYYDTVIAFNKREGIKLPTNYSRLREAVRRYKIEGALSLISGKFGNNNSKKVVDEVALALLREMLRHPYKFSDSIIAIKYNEWAAANGRATLTEATVGNYRRANEKELTIYRKGIAAYRDKDDMVIHRSRPTAPLLLINSDDNNLDLYYKNGKQTHWRPAMYVVLDAFNNYPLGYAIGDVVTQELIREAYLDAVHHIHQLTGGYFWAHQVTTDRWGLKSEKMQEFVSSQGILFTPTALGNARGKVIEQSFGHVWHEALKFVSLKTENYSGHNITANDKMNSEWLRLKAKHFPDVTEAPNQIADLINYLRLAKHPETGMSRQAEWLEGWNAMHPERRKPLLDEIRLKAFGTVRTDITNQITNKGIVITVNGEKRIYKVSQSDLERFRGLTGTVTYDPLDSETILLSALDGEVRILASTFKKIPMAIADFKAGDGELLHTYLAEKKDSGKRRLQIAKRDKDILEAERIQAAGLLQANVLDKDRRLEAERSYAQISAPKTDENISPEDWLQDKW